MNNEKGRNTRKGIMEEKQPSKIKERGNEQEIETCTREREK